MGPTNYHNVLLLFSVLSFFYLFIFMWDNYGVIQTFVASGNRRHGARRISSSRAMVGSDWESSSSLFFGLHLRDNASTWPTERRFPNPDPVFKADKLSMYEQQRGFNDSDDDQVGTGSAHEMMDGHIQTDLENVASDLISSNKESISSMQEDIFSESHNDSTKEPDALLSENHASQSALPQLHDNPKTASNSQLGHVQVVIVTTKRSGSSFIGELFNSNRDIFYMFEPMFTITFDVLKHRITNDQARDVALQIWNHTLRCNYSYPLLNTSWLKRGGINSCNLVAAIKRSRMLCPVNKVPKQELGQFISNICLDRPYTVLKTIRVMDIKDLRVFLEDPSLNVRILHLVRDPRAVMNSRNKLKEINSDLLRRKGRQADEVKDLCEHMARNLEYKDHPPPWLQGKYMLVRFEDVAMNPVEETKRIYRHLGMKVHRDVVEWIQKHTHASNTSSTNSNPFSRTRNTEKVINAWRSTIPKSMVEEIEGKCRDIMKALSYEAEIS